jgi:hypothetical protein
VASGQVLAQVFVSLEGAIGTTANRPHKHALNRDTLHLLGHLLSAESDAVHGGWEGCNLVEGTAEAA